MAVIPQSGRRASGLPLHHIQRGVPVLPDRLQARIPDGADHLFRSALVGNLKLLRCLAAPFPVLGKVHLVSPHRQMAVAVPTPV